MKTTTVAVLFATALSTFRRKEDTHFFGRRIEDGVVKNAATIGFLYVALFLFGGLAISMAEGLPMLTCLFETASAVGTVGLSLGITPGLGILVQSDFDSAHVLRQSRGADIDFCRIVRHTKAGGKTPSGKDNGWIKEEAIR